jgi:type IV pilus assembly protein PilV
VTNHHNIRGRPLVGPPRPRAPGFSLIETLAALVVLSVGMIGIAALYGQSLGAGRTALFRSQAVNLVADMADRIRLNRLGQMSYQDAEPANNGCDPAGGGVDCTPDEIAAYDLYVWQQEVERVLPNGEGRVFVDPAGNPAKYTIRVSWQEAGFGEVTDEIVMRLPKY